MDVTVNPDEGWIELAYGFSGTGPDVSERIELDQTHPNYGGVRWWFCCPDCGRRCAYLHLPPSATRFRCRPCYDLAYSSQREVR